MPSRFRRALLSALGVLGAACGSGGPSAGTPSSNPPAASNPCDAALARSASAAVPHATRASKTPGGVGTDVRDPRDFIWSHRIASVGRAQAAEPAGRVADVGDIGVLQDDGSLISSPNNFDLEGVGLRFQRNTAGGYDVSRVEATFRSTLGGRLTLADDDAVAASLPFSFPFYGGGHSALFVSSDGNLTFGQPDKASTERDLGRLLSGAPRVAPFFADLDPSKGGGVFTDAAGDAFTVTWCRVPGFESSSTVTTQAVLFRDGTIEIKFANVSLRDAIVALSPGRTENFVPVDLSGSGAGGSAAVGERFRAQAELDLVTASRRFLSTHADDYDQIAFWTDARVVGDQTFAFQTTINNSVRGIGKDILDFSGEYGSGGRLQGLVVMDNLGKYPDDPRTRFLGADTTLSLLGQETGHRWLALLRFREPNGQDSTRLLGRDESHWSFFFDSDASVMEGNDIEDLGGGSFRTAGAVQRFGPLDLYAMGLLRESEVPSVFFVDNPSGTTREPGSSPVTGVSFIGMRRDVTIDQIVQAMGPRQPSAAQSPRLHREAFVYIVGRGRTADPAALAKLDRIRQEWEGFFTEGTGGRMQMDTALR